MNKFEIKLTFSIFFLYNTPFLKNTTIIETIEKNNKKQSFEKISYKFEKNSKVLFKTYVNLFLLLDLCLNIYLLYSYILYEKNKNFEEKIISSIEDNKKNNFLYFLLARNIFLFLSFLIPPLSVYVIFFTQIILIMNMYQFVSSDIYFNIFFSLYFFYPILLKTSINNIKSISNSNLKKLKTIENKLLSYNF